MSSNYNLDLFSWIFFIDCTMAYHHFSPPFAEYVLELVPTSSRSKYVIFFTILSDQIIATSHDLTPKGSLVGEISLFQEFLGW